MSRKHKKLSNELSLAVAKHCHNAAVNGLPANAMLATLIGSVFGMAVKAGMSNKAACDLIHEVADDLFENEPETPGD